MAHPAAVVAALKALPGVTRPAGMARVSPEMFIPGPGYGAIYGNNLPRDPRIFTDGAFAPSAPIFPTPVDQPEYPGGLPGPRWWQPRVGWNLPTPPGTEGLKLACYQGATTEILTRRGWLLFPELDDSDEVATRNPVTKAFEWQKPGARHAYAYDGELIRFLSRGIDLLVTPNHRILHTSGHGKHCGELIKRADECELLRSGAMIATSKWDAPDLDRWKVPSCLEHGYIHVDTKTLRCAREQLGWSREQLASKAATTASAICVMETGTGKMHLATLNRVRTVCGLLGIDGESVIRPGWLTEMSGDDFAAFMGAYLSGGCTSGTRIFIAQMPYSKGFEPFRSLLTRILGYEPCYDGKSWTFGHEGLALYLRGCGKSAPEKKIPQDILELSTRQLRIFWDFYVLGDGWTYKTGQAITTTSRVLAGQLQEVAQKIGLSATVKSHEVQPGGVIRGRLISNTHTRYDIFLRTTKCPRWTSVERVEYEGTVYCVSVPNGIIYVRRNGKAIWSGNSFDNLATLSKRYSVARACLEIRVEEIRALEWDITLTTDAAKAYQGDRNAMRDFGERKAEARRFFRRPDPDFFSFDHFLNAFLEEIFVFDALALVFRPKFGAAFGMGGRGLLGSNLDSLNLVSGPTVRPLVGLHGEIPLPPSPAYQQFLFGVPRSDYMTIASGADLDETGLRGTEIGEYGSDVMLYAPYWRTRESPYGFPPIERALLPIISGLQKQEYQLDYFQEGTIPAVYISPGDPNISPQQVGELQNALNSLAGDPAYHLKVVVLPPGSKVDPQRPVDLSDSFDYLVMNQVLMAFDCQPTELGIIPDIGQTAAGPGASSVRFAGQQKRDIKSRVSAKPLLKWICDIFNYVLQDICGQRDMQFQFEGLVDDEDKAAITELGVQQIQNGMASIDEVRERLDLPPWGIPETSEPVLFTAQGAIPLSMSTELIRSAIQGNITAGQGTNSGQKKKAQPSIRRGGVTRPNGSHPAPVAPHREPVGTPQHAAAAASIQSPTPRTGGSAARTPVAGSRKKNPADSRRTISGKAAVSELESLKRHLRKGREITTWKPEHITNGILGVIAEDMAKGVLIDIAVARAQALLLAKNRQEENREFTEDEPHLSSISGDDADPGTSGDDADPGMDDGDPGEGSEEDEDDKDEEDNDQHLLNLTKRRQFPGWEHDLRLIENSRGDISQAFLRAAEKSAGLRKKVATGQMFVSAIVLKGLISDTIRDVFTDVMTLMWTKAWNLGYESAESLVTGRDPDFERKHEGDSLQGFLGTEGQHWLDQVSRTGLGGAPARSDAIARTEVARAVNAAVIQCYRDNGVQYKHWIISPDEKTCKTCRSAVKEGIIPLDSIFPNSGLAGPLHVSCRCTVAPAGMNPEPVLAHLGKRFITTGEARQKAREDPSRLGWLLLRAKDEDGKYRFLLQQRSEGTWGMPGGTLHAGEAPWDGALRETTEEIGDLPDLTPSGEFHHMEDDGKTQVYLYLCDVPYFQPKFNGDTPEETQGAAWFRKKEIGELNLTPKFREDWEKGIKLKDNVSKAMDRRDTGEILTSPQQNPQGSGSRWNYPHDGDGTETLPCRCGHGTGQHECRPDSLTCQWCGCPERTYPLGALRPGGGQAPGEMGATEPPSWDMPQSRIYSGGDDGAFGRTGGVPPSAGRFPRQGRELQDRHPVTT